MNSIKMNRLELLSIVKKNLEKHKADYIEAVSDHKIAMENIAEENVKLTKQNQKYIESVESVDNTKLKRLKEWLPIPNSYEKEYGRAIRMLELSVEDVIDVEEDVFNQLVLDEWGWKQQFATASTMYKTMSGRA